MTLKVKLNGKDVDGFLMLNLDLGGGSEGYPDAATVGPATFTLVRVAATQPDLLGLALATNDDGHVEKLQLSIEVLNTRQAVAHEFSASDAYVVSWKLQESRGDGGAPTEEWRIKAGEVEYKAGGSSSKFDWPDTLVRS